MRTHIWIILVLALIGPGQQHPQGILEEIGDVASTAADLLSSAVEAPRNILLSGARATTGIIDSAASRGLEFKVRRLIEKFRGRMANGIPELGIPPLEPFRLDEIRVKVDNPEIGNISLTVTDLAVHRLSTFVIDKAKFSLIEKTISLNSTVPLLYAEGNYAVSGTIGDMIRLNNKGRFLITVRNFRWYVYTVLGYSRGVYLKSFDLDFALGPVLIDVDDFMEDRDLSKIMTQVAQELVPQAVDIIKPDILPGIRDYIAGRVNETIHRMAMLDIFNVILGQRLPTAN